MNYSLDPDTLQEVWPDVEAARARVEALRTEIRAAPDVIAEHAARGELVDLLRSLGELDDALTEAQRAVDRAEIAGTAAHQHLSRLRLAQVRSRRGEFPESNLIFTELLAVSDQFGPVVAAFTHQHAGVNDFAQGHWTDAGAHFAQALEIRDRLELDEAEESRVALAAATRRQERS